MKNMPKNWKTKFDDSYQYYHQHIWQKDLKKLTKSKALIYRTARFCNKVAHHFIEDNCLLQAGALTYLTLLAIVPVLALMFSVSKGLGVHEVLMENLGFQVNQISSIVDSSSAAGLSFSQGSLMAEMPAKYQESAITIFNVVDKTNVNALGILGLIILLWTIIKVMGRIEKTFNHIWKVDKMRSIPKRIFLHLGTLLVMPLLILAITSINALLASDHVINLIKNYFGNFSFLYELLIRSSLFFIILITIILFIKLLPNTKVLLYPAFIGGLITTIAWLILQTIYFLVQSGISMYNVIYGTFAALPFFLVWLHSNWLILLIGVEISYEIQNKAENKLDSK